MPLQDLNLDCFEAQLGRRRRQGEEEPDPLVEAQNGSRRSRSYQEVFQERIRQEVHRLSRLFWPQPYREPASLQRIRQPIQGIRQGDIVAWESILHLDRIIRQRRLDSRAATEQREYDRIQLHTQEPLQHWYSAHQERIRRLHRLNTRSFNIQPGPFPHPTDEIVIWTGETTWFDAYRVYDRILPRPQAPTEAQEETSEEATR